MHSSRSRLGSVGLTVAFTVCALYTGSLSAQENAATTDRQAEAFRLALAGNLDYCRDWLDGKDFKSLSRTAGGLVILAELLARQDDGPAWQQATAPLVSSARSLEAAAKQAEAAEQPDPQVCRDLIARLQMELKATTVLEPRGKPQPPSGSRPPLRTFMYLQEAILSDAKTALAVGEAKNAKLNAVVLSELGQAVLNYRSDAQWSSAGQDFVAATYALADSTSDDPQILRPLARTIGQRCEACHRMR